jgi:hypothetical protein
VALRCSCPVPFKCSIALRFPEFLGILELEREFLGSTRLSRDLTSTVGSAAFTDGKHGRWMRELQDLLMTTLLL